MCIEDCVRGQEDATLKRPRVHVHRGLHASSEKRTALNFDRRMHGRINKMALQLQRAELACKLIWREVDAHHIETGQFVKSQLDCNKCHTK